MSECSFNQYCIFYDNHASNLDRSHCSKVATWVVDEAHARPDDPRDMGRNDRTHVHWLIRLKVYHLTSCDKHWSNIMFGPKIDELRDRVVDLLYLCPT